MLPRDPLSGRRLFRAWREHCARTGQRGRRPPPGETNGWKHYIPPTKGNYKAGGRLAGGLFSVANSLCRECRKRWKSSTLTHGPKALRGRKGILEGEIESCFSGREEPSIKKGKCVLHFPESVPLEAATGFEPVNNGFADRSLTTWACRLVSRKCSCISNDPACQGLPRILLHASPMCRAIKVFAGMRPGPHRRRPLPAPPRCAGAGCTWPPDRCGKGILF